MQVQCDDVTYFVLAQVLDVANQRVVHTVTLQDMVPYHKFPLLTMDLNRQHGLLGIAWRNAPASVATSHVLEANMADQVAVLWLNPQCKCALHSTNNYAQVLPGVYLTVACDNEHLPCYIKISKLSSVSGWSY
jgi:hypothetical protein